MQKRFEGADGIRGLACLIVIVIHSVQIFHSSLGVYLSGTGKIGVWLFFVLSAFLLTAKFARSGFSVRSLFEYALGRVLRILPLFLISVLIYYSAGMLGIISMHDVFRVISFQSMAGHLWTIPVEFKFYLALPFIASLLIFLYQRFGWAICMVVTVALIAVEQAIWPFWLTPENSLDTRWYISSFTIGSFCAIAHSEFRDKITGRLSTILGGAVILLIALSFPVPRNVIFGMPIDNWLMNKFVIYSLLWAVFVIALADGKGFIGSLLQGVFLKKLGAWSYSIYLIHIFVFYVIVVGRADSIPWMVVSILVSIAVGALMFYLIESPLEKLRHRMQRSVIRT